MSQESTTKLTVEELDQAANIIHQWIQGETDYPQQILFDLPNSVYQMLVNLDVGEISTALEDLTFCEMDKKSTSE
jgi:hypothetical protein